jgi:pentatricopeptide repeat protein
MPTPYTDTITYSQLVLSHMRAGTLKAGLALVDEMESRGFEPDATTRKHVVDGLCDTVLRRFEVETAAASLLASSTPADSTAEAGPTVSSDSTVVNQEGEECRRSASESPLTHLQNEDALHSSGDCHDGSEGMDSDLDVSEIVQAEWLVSKMEVSETADGRRPGVSSKLWGKILSCWMAVGRVDEGVRVFERMRLAAENRAREDRGGGHSGSGGGEEAGAVLVGILDGGGISGIIDVSTWNGLLKGLADNYRIEQMRWYWDMWKSKVRRMEEFEAEQERKRRAGVYVKMATGDKVFVYRDKRVARPNAATFGIVVEAFVKCGELKGAMVELEEMLAKGLYPKTSTLLLLMESFVRAREYALATEVCVFFFHSLFDVFFS